QARRDRRRAAVNAVHAVGIHVVGEAARAADAADPHHVFAPDAQLRHDLLHLGQDGVVPAAGAPAHFLIRDEVFFRVLRLVSRGRAHRNYLSTARSGVTFAVLPAGPVSSSIFAVISTTLKGLPWILLRPTASTRYSARRSLSSWPLLSSGTSTRSNR